MLGYLKTFLPWIAFAVLATNSQSRYGALAGLAVGLVLLALDLRAGKQWDALIIEVSSLVFFLALTIAAFTISPAPLGDYGPAISIGWLALTAWGGLAVRKPFTLGIAKTMVPKEFHNNPMFYRVNAIITAVWAIAFTLTAGLLALLLTIAPHATAAIVAVKICGFVIPALFTVRYQQIVRARQEALR